MYTFESRIRYSELDETGHLSLESLLDYFQDCSTFHSEDIGVGIEYLTRQHMVWVMSYWQIVVTRYPVICEKVSIGTAPYEFKGFMGFRNFWMTDEDGNQIAYANSLWSLLSTDNFHPVKLTDEMHERYQLAPKLNMNYESRKIAVPSLKTAGESILIKKHHLDTNHHVNNGQFVRIALDAIENKNAIHQLRAEYKKQVLLDDTLIPYIAITQQGRNVIELQDSKGEVCCVVEVQKERGAE